MLFLFLLYALIPVLILLRIPRTVDKSILWCRFRYAAPAMILTVINVGCFLYHYLVKPLTIFKENPYAFLLPGLLLAVVLIIYNSGRKQEKLLQTEVTSREIERVRFKKSSDQATNIIIQMDDVEQIEKL